MQDDSDKGAGGSPAPEQDDSNQEGLDRPAPEQDDSSDEVATGPAQEQDDSNQEVVTSPANKQKTSHRGVWIAIGVVVVLLIAAGVAYALYEANSDSDTAEEEATGGGAVELPQNPSLKMVEEEGTLYVENDGNVTMSDVEVRDAAGTTVCELGVISPGDREPCEEQETHRT